MKHILCLGDNPKGRSEIHDINRHVTTMKHLLHPRSRCFVFVTPVQGGVDVVCTGKGYRGQGTGFREEMRKKIETRIAAMEGLKEKSAVSAEFSMWRVQTEEILKGLFGKDSDEVQEFNAIYYTPVFLTCRMGDEAFDEAFRCGLAEARLFLQSLMEKIRRPG